MKKTILFLLTNCLIINAFTQSNPNNWIFYKEANDISVYYRTTENSNIKDLKLTTKINSNVKKVQSIITNVELLYTWGYGCMESKLIKWVGNNELFYYYAADAPWPIDDRDVVINMKISHDSITGVTNINSTNYNGFVAEREDRTRVQYVKAHWQLTPLTKDMIQLDFMISSDLGSNFPDWLVNYAMSISPINSITNLKEKVKEKK